MRKLEDYAEWLDPLGRYPFVNYDPETGMIVSWGNMARISLDQLIHDERQPYLVGEGHPNTHYVDVAAREIRAKQPGQAQLAGLELTGLPVPCWIEIEGEIYRVDDGHAALSFDEPGEYAVTVHSVPFLAQTFTVNHEN